MSIQSYVDAEVYINVCFIIYTMIVCILVTDRSTGRVGAPLTCNEVMLVDWAEGKLELLALLYLRAAEGLPASILKCKISQLLKETFFWQFDNFWHYFF